MASATAITLTVARASIAIRRADAPYGDATQELVATAQVRDEGVFRRVDGWLFLHPDDRLDTLAKELEAAHRAGLGVNAGHDLDLDNLTLFRTLPHLAEVSIGHAIIARWNLLMVTRWSHHTKHHRKSCFNNVLHRYVYACRLPDDVYGCESGWLCK